MKYNKCFQAFNCKVSKIENLFQASNNNFIFKCFQVYIYAI